ncbi:MAG: GFA family protein [Polyangiaceae bacterium]
MRREGGCHCGRVRFALEGEPFAVAYCHCSICRRSSGAPFVFVGMWQPGQLEVLGGEPLTERATSSYLKRRRCPDCGAAIYNAVSSARMQSVNVMLPLLDEKPNLRATHHIYYADRVVDVDDGLPKFDGFGMPK